MQIHRRLSFRVLLPVIGFTLLVAAATIAFAIYVTGRFTEEQADTTLRSRAYTVRQIADDYLGDTAPSGPDGNDNNVRDSRVDALLSMEDYARNHGLLIAVFDEANPRLTTLGNLDIDLPFHALPDSDRRQRFENNGRRYDAYTFVFAPWRWRITVVQDHQAYEALEKDLMRGAWVAAGALSAATFAFMLYLAALIGRPITALVNAVEAGRPPEYAGIAEFEFLSTSIGKMMADLADKSAALERHRDHLEHQVAQRTASLRETNGELQRTNRELQETHQQLLQSEKLASIGQLAAGVAHEINNPVGFVNSNLGALDGYVSGLLQVIETYERHESHLRQDVQAAHEIDAVRQTVDIEYVKQDARPLLAESRDGLARVKKIIQDLKDFSHSGTADWQQVDVHQGIESTLNIVWHELKYKAEVIKEFGVLPPIECLPSELNQVFMNLLVNAGHAIAERGTITIRTAATADEVSIEVADTGRGIAPEHLPRIFDPFFTTKAVGQGTGLGLSVSHGIVLKHHGRIEVHSTPGVGTVFRIHLPIRQTVMPVAGATAPVPTNARPTSGEAATVRYAR